MAKGPGALHKGLMIVIQGSKAADEKKSVAKEAKAEGESLGEEKMEKKSGDTDDTCPHCGHKL